MIYINFVALHSLMLNNKFQNHRPSGSGVEDLKKFFAIYSHGSHLGHDCDLDLLYTLSFTFPKDASHKVWL